MTLRIYTDARKLEVLRGVIAERLQRDAGDPERTNVLKAIATDMEARSAPVADAIPFFEQRLRNIDRSRTALGYEQGQLIALANDFIGRWPIIRAALAARTEEEETTG